MKPAKGSTTAPSKVSVHLHMQRGCWWVPGTSGRAKCASTGLEYHPSVFTSNCLGERTQAAFKYAHILLGCSIIAFESLQDLTIMPARNCDVRSMDCRTARIFSFGILSTSSIPHERFDPLCRLDRSFLDWRSIQYVPV